MFKKFVLAFVVIVLATLVLLQFPALFLKEQCQYKSFRLFSKDAITVDEFVKTVLDSVEVNLQQSHFYDADQVFDLHFVQGSFYGRLIALFGAEHMASAKFNTHLYLGKPDFANSLLKKDNTPYGWVNLVQIISHEAVHSQMYRDHSNWLGNLQTPAWINEGYAEYISYRPMRILSTYNWNQRLEYYQNMESDWCITVYGAMTPKIYLRDRLVMEYLLDQEQRNIMDLITTPTLSPDQLIKMEGTK